MPEEAFVIGSGPNGLTGAITLARAGLKVRVFEAAGTPGGGARTAQLTLPGFNHDICSAVHPLAVASPIFHQFPLAQHGLDWIHPPVPLAHPLPDGSTVLLHRSIDETARGLGVDGPAYRQIMRPLVANWETLTNEFLSPVHFPKHPLTLARFGLQAIQPAEFYIRSHFRAQPARVLMAGMAGHSLLALDMAASTAFGLVLGMAAHAVGWPIPRGGSQSITKALISYLQSLGGEVVTNTRIASIGELPPARVILCDVTPRQLLAIAGDRFPAAFQRKLERYRYGPGAFKVDWALDRPIPWTNPDVVLAATVHLGASFEEILDSERAPWQNRTAQHPLVLLAQPTLFDPTRAPAGKHTGWAYCHVPNGSTEDMVDRIEAQVERFAPGFRQCILARHVHSPDAFERHNENLIGGDINGGAQNLSQLFLRPTAMMYATPLKNIFICSSSSPPGGGVHGMCGYHAAQAALRS